MTDKCDRTERFLGVDQRVRVIIDPGVRGEGAILVVPEGGGAVERHDFRGVTLGNQVRAVGAAVQHREVVGIAVDTAGVGGLLLDAVRQVYPAAEPVRTQRAITNASLESR